MATFSKSGFAYSSYAAFRPDYPQSLYNTVLSYHSGPCSHAVDLGCGHGVVTRALAHYFDQITGIDPSAGMIAEAQNDLTNPASTSSRHNIAFRASSAESLPFILPSTIDTVVAGQAAHWFSYGPLFTELARVVRSKGTVAFWGYTDPVFATSAVASAVMHTFAYADLASYWNYPGRRIVESRYQEIEPPDKYWTDVIRHEYIPGTNGAASGKGTPMLSREMILSQVMGFVRTWSAYHNWSEAHPEQKPREHGGGGDIVDELLIRILDAEPAWKDPETKVLVEWGTGLVMARRR